MKKKSDHYERLQMGFHLWEGSAPHLGRSRNDAQADLRIRASEHDKNFDLFKTTDVWTHDGWLITTSQLVGGVCRCNVRKGTQVGVYVVEDNEIFYHGNKELPHETTFDDVPCEVGQVTIVKTY